MSKYNRAQSFFSSSLFSAGFLWYAYSPKDQRELSFLLVLGSIQAAILSLKGDSNV